MSGILFHEKCHGDLYIDLSNRYLIMAHPRITKDKIVSGLCNITENPNSPFTFFCAVCQITIENISIVSICFECRQFFNIKEIFSVASRTERISGYYCTKCAKEKDLEIKRSILDIIKKG